jgi:hypothetical protein
MQWPMLVPYLIVCKATSYGLFYTIYCSGAICLDHFLCAWTRFLSINPFDLQLKINSEARFSFDFYYMKSYIGLHFGDSQQHVILTNENWNKAINRYILNIKKVRKSIYRSSLINRLGNWTNLRVLQNEIQTYSTINCTLYNLSKKLK